MDVNAKFGSHSDWAHGGARALVMLHERELRRFQVLWKRAKSAGLVLPRTQAPSYASLEALLHHVLRCAGMYLQGLCSMLAIEAPKLDAPPELPDGLQTAGENAWQSSAEGCLQALLDAYRAPFRSVSEADFYSKTGQAPWGVSYCVDAFFEHAVMHPVRHTLQLELLLAEAGQLPGAG